MLQSAKKGKELLRKFQSSQILVLKLTMIITYKPITLDSLLLQLFKEQETPKTIKTWKFTKKQTNPKGKYAWEILNIYL